MEEASGPEPTVTYSKGTCYFPSALQYPSPTLGGTALSLHSVGFSGTALALLGILRPACRKAPIFT